MTKTTDTTMTQNTDTMNTTTTISNTTPTAALTIRLKAKPKAKPEAGSEVIPEASPPASGSIPVAAVRAPDDFYYDHHLGRYWSKMPSGIWIKLDKYDVLSHLVRRFPIFSDDPEERKRLLYEARVLTQEYNSVSFAGDLAGYSEGLLIQGGSHILVTSSPKYITGKPGDWGMLRGILERMFGDEQLPYVYAWIKLSLEMFATKEWMAAQVLVLCGPAQAGKNLFGVLLGKMFGGRAPGKPYAYMTQKTDFNSDFMGCEFLTIEDEASLFGIQARRDFGSKIKDMSVNTTCRLHRKHAEALTVIPLQRLLISLNDEPERLQVLPPIEGDIEDKLMLLKVAAHPMPMPTNTPQAKAAFSAALLAQLPAFVHFLQEWQIPAELVSDRFGVKHYHHPDILECLYDQSPEEQLLELIDDIIFPVGQIQTAWEGKAVDLGRRLKSASSDQVQREAEKLLPSANSCGKYLGRLVKRHPDRVFKYAGSGGIRNWKIMPPSPFGRTVGSKCSQIADDDFRKKLRSICSGAKTMTPVSNDLGDKQSDGSSEAHHDLTVKVKAVRIKGESPTASASESGDTQESAA